MSIDGIGCAGRRLAVIRRRVLEEDVHDHRVRGGDLRRTRKVNAASLKSTVTVLFDDHLNRNLRALRDLRAMFFCVVTRGVEQHLDTAVLLEGVRAARSGSARHSPWIRAPVPWPVAPLARPRRSVPAATAPLFGNARPVLVPSAGSPGR